MHAPETQIFYSSQALPHVPQFLVSDCKSTHVPQHRSLLVSSFSHETSVLSEQVPSTHVWVLAHCVSQLPQCFGEVLKSAHSVPQALRSFSHTIWHTPSMHDNPSAQALPHSPQFFTSVSLSMQLPQHSVLSSSQLKSSFPGISVVSLQPVIFSPVSEFSYCVHI